MKITIIGTGYVGLVTGVSFASPRNGSSDHTVVCIGRNKEKIDAINNGTSPFFEPGLDPILKKAVKTKKLSASSDLAVHVHDADVIIIAVGTPTEQNRIDLTALKVASQQIGAAMKQSKKYQLVLVKSTVLPGTTEKIVLPLIEKYSGKKIGEFGIGMNPEFLREGNAVKDAMEPDRIVIGSYDTHSEARARYIYQHTYCTKIAVNIPTAEMTKYAANGLFATMISYSNEIARLCEKTPGVDVVDVWEGVHADARLTPRIEEESEQDYIFPGFLSYIFSGCGYGGSCFPKDTKALAQYATTVREKGDIIRSVVAVNETQPYRVVELLKQELESLRGKRIAVLGLTFKPDTDDTRESASFSVIHKLIEEGAIPICHDPMIKTLKHHPLFAVTAAVWTDTYQEALTGADAACVLTGWSIYKRIIPQVFKNFLKYPLVVDGRRIYDKRKFIKAGVVYKGIGLS